MALRQSPSRASTTTTISAAEKRSSSTVSRKRKLADKDISIASATSTVSLPSSSSSSSVSKRKAIPRVVSTSSSSSSTFSSSSVSSTPTTSTNLTNNNVSLPNTLPLTYENRVWTSNPFALVCGVDEAGRGPLAGPVVASACIMFPPCLWSIFEYLTTTDSMGTSNGTNAITKGSSLPVLTLPDTYIPARSPVAGVNDSKALEENDRELIYPLLMKNSSLVFGVSVIDHAVIDRINILQATYLAMSRATARARMEANRRIDQIKNSLITSKLPNDQQKIIREWFDRMQIDIVQGTLPTTTTTPTTITNKTNKKGKGSDPSNTVSSSSPYPVNLHTVFIDGPKVPFRIEAAANPDPNSRNDSRNPDNQKDIDEHGKEYTVLPPDHGVQEVELKDVDIDGGFNAVLHSTKKKITLPSSSSSSSSLASSPLVTDLYTQKLQALLGYIFTVQPVIGGDSKVYSIAAGK